MKNQRALPIPFLILILAGVVSLFSLAADRAPQAGTVKNDALQMQTVEQERMAECYFQVLSWLSDALPRAGEPAKARPRSTPVATSTQSPSRHNAPCRIELCVLRATKNLSPSRSHTPNLN